VRERDAGAAAAANVAVAQAHRLCESITRERAANFYYGIRLLPAERRRAMCAVYAFARRVDDIGDGPLEPGQKLARLEQARASLELLLHASGVGESVAADPVLVALADARHRFAIEVQALEELIEGVRMDVLGTTYETFPELELYCRRVAGTIGRLCLAVFTGPAATDERSTALADDLGVALQLTNILRDLREDAENGRVYLPADDLRRFELEDLRSALVHAGSDRDMLERLTALVRFEAQRAHEWFEHGMRLVAQLDRRSAACVSAMAGIYRRLLARIADDPRRVLRERVSLPAPEKAWVAARAMVGLAR
jgi:phytoene synthase